MRRVAAIPVIAALFIVFGSGAVNAATESVTGTLFFNLIFPSAPSGGGQTGGAYTDVIIKPDSVTLFYDYENEFTVTIQNKKPINQTFTFTIPEELQAHTFVNNMPFNSYQYLYNNEIEVQAESVALLEFKVSGIEFELKPQHIYFFRNGILIDDVILKFSATRYKMAKFPVESLTSYMIKGDALKILEVFNKSALSPLFTVPRFNIPIPRLLLPTTIILLIGVWNFYYLKRKKAKGRLSKKQFAALAVAILLFFILFIPMEMVMML